MRVRYAGVMAAVVLSIVLAAGAVMADPVQDGEASFNRGDYAGALHDWLPLAERGDPRAENWVGLLYHNGFGVAQDDAAAVAWYRQAAARGYPVAQFNLAAEYLAGTGVPHNDAQAVYWLGKAARQGYVPAEREFGTLYHQGRGGLRQSTPEALKWWGAAAKAGDVEAARLARQAQAEESAERAAQAREEAARRAGLPEELARNKPVNYWRLWRSGCFDYTAAQSFAERRPRGAVALQQNCCPGVLTVKGLFKDNDGVAQRYLVAFAARSDGYCPVQFFGGWVSPEVIDGR